LAIVKEKEISKSAKLWLSERIWYK